MVRHRDELNSKHKLLFLGVGAVVVSVVVSVGGLLAFESLSVPILLMLEDSVVVVKDEDEAEGGDTSVEGINW